MSIDYQHLITIFIQKNAVCNMKTSLTLLLFSLALFSCNNSSKQVPPSATDASTVAPTPTKTEEIKKPQTVPLINIDSIEAKDISVQNITLVTAPMHAGDSLMKLADSVTHGEITEFSYIYTEYNIKKTVIRYHEKEFAGFNMQDNTLTFTIKGQRIKIGDNAGLLKTIFPKPFAERDSTSYIRAHKTMVYLDVKDRAMEVHFTLNAQGIITEIEVMTVLDA
jgi:hypothetical protein